MTKIKKEIWNQTFKTDGEPIVLAEVEAERIVLFFYPKDNTPGCSIEVQEFNQLLPQFKEKNWAVFGVSRDGVASHQRFVEKFGLNFPLIVDDEEILCKELDLIKEKNVFGKIGLGIERSTFIFDQAGTILKEWRKVTAKGHAEEVINAL